MNNISFQSRIRPVGSLEFRFSTLNFDKKQFVDYPWTIKESVVSNNAFTKNVYDCTVCGITDGIKVFLMHICPTRKENHDFSKIFDFIKTNVDLTKNNLQAFLFGSIKHSPENRSEQIFNNFENFLKEFGIPYSKIKGSSEFSDIAYSAEKDEWLIKQDDIGKAGTVDEYKTATTFLRYKFDEVKINDLDNVDW